MILLQKTLYEMKELRLRKSHWREPGFSESYLPVTNLVRRLA